MSTSPSTDQNDRKRKRGTIVKFSLAAVALLGIGAAATSAAWTDDAWFSASASSAKVELQGSLDGTAWQNADGDVANPTIAIPATTFADLVPNETRTVDIKIKNISSVPLTIGTPTLAAVAQPTGNDIFAGGHKATFSAALKGTTEIAPLAVDGVATYTVTVKAYDWSDTDQAQYANGSGSLTLRFTGTAVAKTP